MGLKAGKSTYGCSLAVGKNATSDGPLTSSDYITFAVPVEQLNLGWTWSELINRAPGGYSISSKTGEIQKGVNIQKAIVDPQVQATAMEECNAITELLEDWGSIGENPVYFFCVLNSKNKTWTDSTGTKNKFLLVKPRNANVKINSANQIEMSLTLEDAEE